MQFYALCVLRTIFLCWEILLSFLVFSDHTVEGLWRAAKQVFDEYPRELISIEYGHLYSNYNECLKQNGDNRYKNPHDGVRVKFNNGEPLNKCNLISMNT